MTLDTKLNVEVAMNPGGLSSKRLKQVHDVLQRHVDAGHGPGAIAMVIRRGEAHTFSNGYLAFEGPNSSQPMTSSTICQIASWTKPIVAACAMTFVEDCTLRLTEPIDALLPELTNMRVLADPTGPLDKTVPAKRPITLHDILTGCMGTGTVLAKPGEVPIADALLALEHGESSGDPTPSSANWLRRLGDLPLVSQPGERWMYYIPSIVLGILLTRVTSKPLGEILEERILRPLGMCDTGFCIKPESAARVATPYRFEPTTGKIVPDGGPTITKVPAPFKEPASGLVSTLRDFSAFTSTMLAEGKYDGTRILSRPAISLMTSDHLTPAQKAASTFVWPPGIRTEFGWGFGLGINTLRTFLGPSSGSYGWYGKYGTVWFNDPNEDMTTILILQTDAYAHIKMPVFQDFLTTAYSAIDD